MKGPKIKLVPTANLPKLNKWLLVACAAIFTPGFGQMDFPPKINLNDTTITTRDSLYFAPQTFRMCLYSYQTQYEITADASMDSIPHYLIRLTSRQNPNCPLAAGYSGPVIVLKNLPLGMHRLVFTNSSDFKLTMPDSLRIRVIEHGSSASKYSRDGRMHPRPAKELSRYSADGRLVRRDSPAPWIPLFLP